MNKNRVSAAQTPLREQYQRQPEAAWVMDEAITSSDDHSDPFHASVTPMRNSGISVPIGVHRAVGGLHDAPTPGDMLCAALAACQDSSIRMVANLLGIELTQLQVKVEADVDVRGTLGVNKTVPVGFQAMRCHVHLKVKPGTDPQLLKTLEVAAQKCCVVQQTLRNPPPIATLFAID